MYLVVIGGGRGGRLGTGRLLGVRLERGTGLLLLATSATAEDAWMVLRDALRHHWRRDVLHPTSLIGRVNNIDLW